MCWETDKRYFKQKENCLCHRITVTEYDSHTAFFFCWCDILYLALKNRTGEAVKHLILNAIGILMDIGITINP